MKVGKGLKVIIMKAPFTQPQPPLRSLFPLFDFMATEQQTYTDILLLP